MTVGSNGVSVNPPSGDSTKQPSGDTMGQQGFFDSFAGRLQAFNGFIQALAQYKLADAKEQLILAQADQQEARAEILWAIANQLESDIYRMNVSSQSAERRINAIARKARYAQHLLSGTRMADFQGCASAYKYFETQAKIEAGESLFSSLTTSPDPITADDFFDNRDPGRACQAPQPGDLRNALALIDWTFRMQYVAKSGSAAEEHFVSLFKAIASVAGNTINEIGLYMDQMRQKTYDVWKPVQILGIEPTAEEKKVLEGTRPKAAA
jgi:hypothetical protein